MKPLRDVLLVTVAAAALYTAGHMSSLPPRAQVPSDLLGRFAPFPSSTTGAYKNGLLLDPVLQFEPWLAWSRAELAAGRLPTWNPRQGLGTVHLANDQSAVFSLWSLPYYALGPPGLFFSGLGKALALCLGLFLFLRDEGLGRRAALAGGLALSACAPVVAWQLHPHTGAFAYVGLLLFFAGRTARAKHWLSGWGIGLAVVTALTLFAGHAQLALQAAVITAGWTLIVAFRLVGSEGPGAAAMGLAQTFGAAFLGLALASVHVIPFVEALGFSEALVEHQGAAASVKVPAKLMAMGLFPDLHGSPRDGLVFSHVLGQPGYLEQVGPYAGAALLALAPLGFLPGGRRGHRRLALVFAAVAGVLALVVYGPLASVFADLPPFSWTRNHRFTFLIALAVCVVGAVGFDRVLRGEVRRIHLAWVAVGLLVLGYAASLTIESSAPVGPWPAQPWGWEPGPQGRFGRGLVFALAVPTAGALASLTFAGFRAQLGRRLAGVLIGAVVALELLAFGYDFAPGVPADQVRPPLPALAQAEGQRLLTVGPRALWPNLASAYGAHQINHYDALGNRLVRPRLERLAPFKEQGPLMGTMQFEDDEADALGIRYVLTDHADLAKNLRRGLNRWLPISQPRGGPWIAIPAEGVGQTLFLGPHPLDCVALPAVQVSEPTVFTLKVHTLDGRTELSRATVHRAAGDGEVLFRLEQVSMLPRARVRLTLHAEPPGAQVVYSQTDVGPGERLHAGRPAPGDLTLLCASRVSAPYGLAAEWPGTWLLSNPDAQPRWRLEGPAGGSVDLLRETPTEVVLVSDSAGPATVILADAYTPGWIVTVDGVEAPLQFRDGLRAVGVPAGIHEVTFVHAPDGVRDGLLLSLAALLLLALGVLAIATAPHRPGWTGRP